MSDSSSLSKEMDQELFFISKFRSQYIAKQTLNIALISYITYCMFHGLNSLPPFYILCVTNLLPFAISSHKQIQQNKKNWHFTRLHKRFKVSQTAYTSNGLSLLFVGFLLLLWQIVQMRTTYIYMILRLYPLLLLLVTTLLRLVLTPLLFLLQKHKLSYASM